MNQHNHQTAPTEFVEGNGIRFAYRRFGKPGGVPLVLNMHFTGTMDHWDPLVTDGFASDREVVLFDNAGIGGPRDAKPNSLDVEAWLNVFKVNSVAPMLVAFGLRDNLLKGKDKKLATITSVLGSTAANGGGMQPYRASKAAVDLYYNKLAADCVPIAHAVNPNIAVTDASGGGRFTLP